MFAGIARALIALTLFTATVSGGLVLGTEQAHAATICGILEHVSGSNRGVQVFRGLRNGTVTVNFSRNGRIESRMRVNVVRGQLYCFDGRGAVIGFSC